MLRAVRINVSGLVQGVGFRYCTILSAQKYHIKGYVKNEPDGSVTAVAQGEEEMLAKFITEVKRSPSPVGRVDQYHITDISPDEYTRFSVRY